MNILLMLNHQFIIWMPFYDELFMKFENLVKFIQNSEYPNTIQLMI